METVLSTKYCRRCNDELPISNFYLNPKTNKHFSYCRKCTNEYNLERKKIINQNLAEKKPVVVLQPVIQKPHNHPEGNVVIRTLRESLCALEDEKKSTDEQSNELNMSIGAHKKAIHFFLFGAKQWRKPPNIFPLRKSGKFEKLKIVALRKHRVKTKTRFTLAP